MNRAAAQKIAWAATRFVLSRHLLRWKWNISSGAGAETGRIWSRPRQSFAQLHGSLEAHWSAGSNSNYEMQWQERGGKTFGEVPLDELFMLGVERDNDLWMRAHI